VRAAPGVHAHLTSPLPPGVLTLVHRVDNDDRNVEVDRDGLLVQWPTKPLRGRSPVFRTSPPSEALAPERATSGYNRPFGGPHLWASDPAADGPAWLRLDWEHPVEAAEVRLVFDDDVDLELNTLHHHRSPDEVMPPLVRDYRVEVQAPGADEWRVVAEEHDNRHRLRVHPLPADLGPFTAARLVVERTNGAAEARVVAFRVQS